MKNNKIMGSVFGAILGFIFVITCTSPVLSDTNEVTNDYGKYQISTTAYTTPVSGGEVCIFETTFNTETGDVISRKRKVWSAYPQIQ
jgi:hypothetical protein